MKAKDFQVKLGSKVDLKKIDTDDTGGFAGPAEAAPALEKRLERIADIQERLYAESKQALLLIFQGMDTSGKDGATKSVMREVNPQGVEVTSFKAPSKEELSHDFLWRVEKRIPPRGMIGVFNRSHYEDVLVVRIHNLVPKEVWSKRYDIINDFEARLDHEYVRVIKIFLHISKDEQKRRLQDRLKAREKLWKFNVGDLAERKFWGDYREAYEDVLSKCSTEHAPWHIVPADKKWYRNVVVADIVQEALEEMEPKFPKLTFDPATVKID
jgi:PPK2 family polyphosphate:nucleotide phosphotransferase